MGLLDRLFRRTTPAPEQRAAPLTSGTCELSTAAGWSAGINVTQERAIGLAAYWACLRVISETMGTMPRLLMEDRDTGMVEAKENPLYSLIREEPNDYQSGPAFWEAFFHQAGQGNGYAAIERRNDRPAALHLMHAPAVETVVREGTVVYRYWTPRGVMEFLGADVLHLMGPSPDGLKGYQMLTTHRQTFGRTLAVNDFSANFFERGGAISGTISHPGVLKPEAVKNLRESWESLHSGVSNAFRVAILEAGGKFEQIGTDPESAQMNESRTAQVLEICRLMRVPPHKIGHLQDAKFANIEQQNIEFATDTVRPWCVKAEAEMERKLLFPGERKKLRILFDMDALLRGDMAARTARYESGMRWGYMNINQINKLEGFPAVEGGNVNLVPMNMQPLDRAIKGPPTPAPAA